MQQVETNKSWGKIVPVIFVVIGLGTAAIAIGADQIGIGGLPGFGPNQISLTISGLALLVAGVAMNSSVNYRRIGQWLLIIAGVIAVGLAADLLIFGGLPGTMFKQFMLLTVIAAIALTAVVASPVLSRKSLVEWLKLAVGQWAQVFQFALIVLQLGLLILLVRSFELESQAFYNSVMMLTFYGFLVHFFLPMEYRMPFFLLLSLVAIIGIFGAQNGAWLIGVGLAMIGVCHLPVKYSLRVGILVALGVLLAAFRAEALPSPVPAIIWPILGSMFMFRLIIYMYDLRFEKEPNFWRTLSYFFLLPNVVFPFFPLVDYNTFRRTYFNGERFKIYQTGLEWILRGALHLIFYRFVNYYLAMAPEAVNTASELVQYTISNFLLYVRVSGQFHMVIGLLHLFGFNLPETFHQYFMATGFTDLWRRFNIYWKDFMQKIVYNPTYVRLKKLGTTRAVLLATVWIFVMMWAFHSYQWFWLIGTSDLTPHDLLFRFLLTILMITSTYMELTRGRKRSLAKKAWDWREIGLAALRGAGTFTIMAILWALWTGNSIAGWLALMSLAGESVQSILMLLAAFLGIALLFLFVTVLEKITNQAKERLSQGGTILKLGTVNGAFIGAILLLGSPIVYSRIGGTVQAVIEDLKVSHLSQRDAEQLRRGYYEDIMGVNRFNPDLWEIYSKRPTDWPLLQDTEAVDLTTDFLIFRVNPNQSIMFHGARFSTNEWGMRDKSYSLTPPPNTYRMAIVGPSYVMGSGVADNETFEWVLEDRLNQENDGYPYAGYEILNFAVAGHSALQELYYLDSKVLDFEPDVILYIAHQLEEEVIIRNLGDRFLAGSEIPYDNLQEVFQRAGVQTTMTQEEIERQLKPFAKELIGWTYGQIVAMAQRNGMSPVWIYIPALELPSSDEVTAELRQLAEAAGFMTIDLSDVYAGQDIDKIIVAEWDKHPNARGHQLIAFRLYEELKARSEALRLGLDEE